MGLQSFTFLGLTLRPAAFSDLDLAHEWTKADPDHRDDVNAFFWTENGIGIESYLLEDQDGPIFFFKMTRRPHDLVEIDMQFPPEGKADRRRIARAMVELSFWVESALALRGIARICFRSKSPSLIRFCKRKLDYQAIGEQKGGIVVLAKPITHRQGNTQEPASGN